MMKFNKILAPVAALSTGLVAAVSQAAVNADITTAMDTAKTDATTIAVGVLLIIVAIMAVKWLRKAL